MILITGANGFVGHKLMELCKDTERETAHGAVYGEEGAIRALREAIFSPRESADDSDAGEGDGMPREVIVGG